MANVQAYFDSRLGADDVLAMGFQHVAIATGSTWRRDGVGRFHNTPMPLDPAMPIFSPDDLMAGSRPAGRVLLYDDDHYYMGGVLAELLVANGNDVVLATPATRVSDWTWNTLEQGRIQRRLIEIGVEIHVTRALTQVMADGARLACVYSGRSEEVACEAVVMVTARLPEDGLLLELRARRREWEEAGIATVKAIGDADAPAPIAWATHAGHRFAEEMDAAPDPDAPPFRREVARLA
jgi:dimethylamine/trimethylamine dehydrogenase